MRAVVLHEYGGVSGLNAVSGANAFEIGDIQEDETEGALTRRSDVTMLHWVENGWMEFSGSAAARERKIEDTVARSIVREMSIGENYE